MVNKGNYLYEFGLFRVDGSQGLLFRDGQPVRLPPKTFELLLFFLARCNQVIDKETLMREVWSDAFVEDANLTVHISTLRKALNGDGQKAVTIETFPKIGYRFNADVRELTNNAAPTSHIISEETNGFSEATFSNGSKRAEEFDAATGRTNAPLTRSKVRPARIIVAAVLGAVVLIGIGFALKKLFGTGAFNTPTLERLRGTEQSSASAISPNGEYLAHAVSKAGKRTLMMTNIASNSSVQLLPPDEALYYGLTFTKDGSFLYFVKSEGETLTLYKIPVLGNAAAKVLDNVGQKISFSPKSEKFCFVRKLPDGETAIMTANADGTDERVIALRKAPEYFDDFSISWSPDGKFIANAAGIAKSGRGVQIIGVDVEIGAERLISDAKWTGSDGIEWLGDGSGLVASLVDNADTTNHVWFIPYPSGEPRKITNDPNNYGGVGVSSDGKTMLAVQFKDESSLWTTPYDQPTQSQPVTNEKHHMFQWVRWTADGRLLFASSVGDHRDVWVMNSDGSGETQLTTNAAANKMPTATADERFIIFASSRSGDGPLHLWRANADGSEPVQLTNGGEQLQPDTTPAGHWVFYTSSKTGGSPLEKSIWKVSIDGGEPVMVIGETAHSPDVSPDGKYLLCWYKPNDETPWTAAIFPIEGGKPVRSLDIPADSPIHWTTDGKGVSYVKTMGIGGASNIWTQSLSGKSTQPATQFTSEGIANFDWSNDGRLVTSRTYKTRDVFLIHNFR